MSSFENISAKNNDSPIFVKKSSYIDNKFCKYFNELFFSKIDSNYYLRNHGEILLRIHMMTKFGTDISSSEMSLLSLGPCETSKTTKSC